MPISDNFLLQTAASKVPAKPSYGKFRNWGHPNRPFSEVLQRWDQGKLSQKWRATSGVWKTAQRKLAYLLISMRLKCQHTTTFCRKRRLQKCPQSRAMANSTRTPKSPIFWDFANGGPRETGPKSRPTSGAWKTPWRNCPYLLISMPLKCQHRTSFCRKRRLQKCPQSRAMANSARTPNSPIFWDFTNGGPRETEPKSRATSGA